MTEEPFVISYVLDDDILVIRLHGKLDTTSTPEFNAEVEKHFQEGKRKIIIDCAKLAYISSLGIGAVVSLQAKLRMQGGEVKLAAVQTMVADIIRIVRLEKIVEIHGDIESARASFNK